MTPDHWPSFWLGFAIAWCAPGALLVLAALLWELSDALNRLEHHLKQRHATARRNHGE